MSGECDICGNHTLDCLCNQKEYVLLFNLIERSDLQSSLNELVYKYNVTQINVWQDSKSWWCAFVRYKENHEKN